MTHLVHRHLSCCHLAVSVAAAAFSVPVLVLPGDLVGEWTVAAAGSCPEVL